MSLNRTFIIILALAAFACSSRQKSDRQEDNTTQTETATEAGTAEKALFKHEGDLYFTDTSGARVKTIEIEIADNNYDRERGLMHRQYLPEDAGMLFLFGKEEYRSFWMKNTAISLDILFISSDSVINTIQKYTVPYSEASVPSAAPSIFVLEVNAGFCDNHGIREGMKIDWQRIQRHSEQG